MLQHINSIIDQILGERRVSQTGKGMAWLPSHQDNMLDDDHLT
jgi:hypothetical protein